MTDRSVDCFMATLFTSLPLPYPPFCYPPPPVSNSVARMVGGSGGGLGGGGRAPWTEKLRSASLRIRSFQSPGFHAWSSSEYSFACFTCCQEIWLSNFFPSRFVQRQVSGNPSSGMKCRVSATVSGSCNSIICVSPWHDLRRWHDLLSLHDLREFVLR